MGEEEGGRGEGRRRGGSNGHALIGLSLWSTFVCLDYRFSTLDAFFCVLLSDKKLRVIGAQVLVFSGL